MLGPRQDNNQREAPRFIVKKGAYAILKQNNYSEIAKIIDISLSGVSFLCINEGDWDKNAFFIDIVMNGYSEQNEPCSKHLINIPLRPIIYSTRKCESPLPDVEMQRCGVRFGDLTTAQKHSLNEYISKYTYGSS